MLHKLCADQERSFNSKQPRKPRALILTPTRELAAQVHDSVRAYGKHVRVHAAAVFGGVGMGGQIMSLRRGLDLIVATPGRLIDHMDRRNVDLSCIEMLVLDEADRMLDMGFAPALKKILSMLPKQKQTLLFSATFAPEIKALAAQFMRNPQEVQMAKPNAIAIGVSHRVHPVESEKKRDLLLHLLAADSRRQTLVFSRTKHGADKLCRFLEQHGFRAAAIHGNKSQSQRTRALADFKRGKTTVLVATDIAARGLDIEQLPAVVNYDLPMVAEDYVHRIGRTGRAGAEGLALSLVSREEEGLLRDIRRLLKQDLTIETVQEFAPSWSLRMEGASAPSRRPNSSRPQRRPQHAQGARDNAKPGKPHAHARHVHPARGNAAEHAVGNKKRRWRGDKARNA